MKQQLFTWSFNPDFIDPSSSAVLWASYLISLYHKSPSFWKRVLIGTYFTVVRKNRAARENGGYPSKCPGHIVSSI